jgi:hypothetical protein
LHAEHARIYLKVEYLGRIEYDFQKSRVTGPWDHKVSVSAKKVLKKFHACVPLSTVSQQVLSIDYTVMNARAVDKKVLNA